MAMKNSLIFRDTLRSLPTREFFTYCWVIVDPPWVSPPLMFFHTARARPMTETPLLL